MGDYINQADLEIRVGTKRLIQLTNEGMSDSVDADVLEGVIADAEAEVNAFLGRYDLPFEPVPPLLKKLTTSVATYLLHDRKQATKMGEKVFKGYENTQKLLTQIAKGTLTLGARPEPAQNPGRAASTASPSRHFSRSKMAGF